MVAWAIKGFGGMIPRTEGTMLPDNASEQAVNCDLSSGILAGLPTPVFTISFPGSTGVRRAYRFPDPLGGADIWLPLPSEFSSVVRSPLANDTSHRLYWTNPGDVAPHWATRDMLFNNTRPYDLGIAQPPSDSTGQLTVTVSGGTSTIPQISRSYLYTFVNAFGEESAPSLPSAVVSGAPDGTWALAGLPTAAPANPTGLNYPPVVSLNLYRTLTGTTTGAQFYQVTTLTFPVSSSTYTDTTIDTAIVNNLTLISTSFANPVPKLDGLITMTGGMLIGFTGNTIHFCEPDRPHAWPAAYDQSLQYDIVGLAIWQQALVVLTKGFPFQGSGSSPSNFLFTMWRVPEPCIARGSIITDLLGVYYASQNGLVMLNYFGMQNQTLQNMTKNIWLTDYRAANIIACRHRAQYLAINGTDQGFIIDYSESRLGFMKLNTFLSAVCVWNDEYTGDAYICANNVVYKWDSPNTAPLVYRWRSKEFYLPAPVSLGACQISLDPSITTVVVSPADALDNGDPSLVLPAGVNAVFKLYAGPDPDDVGEDPNSLDSARLVLTRNLTKSREIFRLPSGFKAFEWQCEIVSRAAIYSIELASTMKELKGV
jgi:hypothetical protein